MVEGGFKKEINLMAHNKPAKVAEILHCQKNW